MIVSVPDLELLISRLQRELAVARERPSPLGETLVIFLESDPRSQQDRLDRLREQEIFHALLTLT